MVNLCEKIEMGAEEMRHAYCDALISEAASNPRIVSIDCDLSNSCGTNAFGAVFPDRAFNMGIAEQNGCAVCGGLSASGMVPFFHSFAVFSSRRICDQVFMSCAYAGHNVKIIGCDAGISASFNGGTHMAFEDVGIMRVIPTITIVEPSDPVMMKSVVPQMASINGVFYLRMPRKQVHSIYQSGSSFTIGKGAVLREGADVTLIASGMEVVEALWAAEALAAEGFSARVVDMFTIKPIDKLLVLECAQKTGAIVTAENENILGGLGSAVAEILVENHPVPMERVGIEDRFGEVGPVDYLKEHFGLTAPHIVKKAKQAIHRKPH